MKGKYPFTIDVMQNKAMNCYDLRVQIGGIKTKEELDAFAKALAEYISNGNGTAKRVYFDA